MHVQNESLSNRCVTCATLQTGTDSAASPLGVVRIPRVCHPVPPCATLCQYLFFFHPCQQGGTGGTGWHRVAHPRIRTTPKGEAAESVPVCGVAQVAHRFDKLFNLHMYIVTHVICMLTFFLTDQEVV